MNGVWAGLLLVAVIFASGAVTLTITYRADQRRDELLRDYADPPDDDWGDDDDGPDTQPGPLDQTYRHLEALYHQPAAERRNQ